MSKRAEFGTKRTKMIKIIENRTRDPQVQVVDHPIGPRYSIDAEMCICYASGKRICSPGKECFERVDV